MFKPDVVRYITFVSVAFSDTVARTFFWLLSKDDLRQQWNTVPKLTCFFTVFPRYGELNKLRQRLDLETDDRRKKLVLSLMTIELSENDVVTKKFANNFLQKNKNDWNRNFPLQFRSTERNNEPVCELKCCLGAFSISFQFHSTLISCQKHHIFPSETIEWNFGKWILPITRYKNI